MGKILPALLALIGLGAGLGGGFLLRPHSGETVVLNPCEAPESAAAANSHAESSDLGARNYVKLANQFVIPVVESGRVAALVIVSLTLEIKAGGSEEVYAVEPRLRDALLQVLFNHANTGGFRGAFTESGNMDALRKALLEAAKKTLGATVTNVLIADIVRQDNA
ncbi:MAG: flagellar basal body-associated protein FliL [Alphaproteobacteria bacterium HGW-Alphaproteobacteria-4]|nr:MAG: flagellar basal body-associated protein FliL [Alphaproteobacteria bacterium HGW-Alphaproteobacteria-4]